MRSLGAVAVLARLALPTLGAGGRNARRRREYATAAMVMLCLVVPLQSCTQVRILRHGDPSVLTPLRIFPQRAVSRAESPFRFPVGQLRADLDTVTVRGVSQAGIPFADYFRTQQLKAFIVIRNDSIVYERYGPGFSDTTRGTSFSVAKSITSALFGIALHSGAVRSLDDSVVEYVPELRSRPDFAGITIRHLLNMQSGFAYTRTTGEAWNDFRSSDAHFYYTSNFRSSIARQRREDPPGTRWAYKDSDTQLLAWVLERATGKTLAAQLEEGIWRRIGTERDASWDLDRRGGSENAASGLNATARDLARFGRLYLNDGAWNGVQIIPRDWVRASTTLDSSRTEPEVVTWWQMQHRNLWWIPIQNWAADRDFYADGSRGQRIYVNRRLRTVIVQVADESAQDFPFRKIARYVAGEPYAYPRSVVGQLYTAITAGASADSVRSHYETLLARAAADPAGWTHSRGAILALARRLDVEKKPQMAALVRSLVE